jgi:ethanolamine ammonia-lyase small subunit
VKIPDLRRFTSARVSLGRSGNALPTAELLNIRFAEVRARHAVHASLDVEQFSHELGNITKDLIVLQSAAPDRSSYVRRPDWGRRLDDESCRVLRDRTGLFDALFIIADGLSAVAVHLHAKPLLEQLFEMLPKEEWRIAPLVIVQRGRVAIGDEIGEILGASLSVLMIGERPGLTASDSLGVYLTWTPHRGLTDADRNCISNVRKQGLSYQVAARRVAFLMNESRRRKISGVTLKEDTRELPLLCH